MELQPILELQNITKRFPGVTALDDVSVAIYPGEVHALLGENGAGKSTLMNIVGGIYRPDGGQILLDGAPVRFRSPEDSIDAGIAFIHQELSLVPALSVAENLFLGHLSRRRMTRLVDWERVFSDARAVLQRNALDLDPHIPVRELSTGLQQQVEIARALALNPKVVIMDEPTSALSEHEVGILLQTIRRLASEGIAIIFISHHMDEVRQIADRLTVLRDGKHILTKLLKAVTSEELAEAMLGHALETQMVRPSSTQTPALTVRGFSSVGAFADIDFHVYQGEIVGIAGLLGAGKTELLRAVFGADRPDSGELLIDDQPVTIQSPRDAIRHGIFLVPEDRRHDGLVGVMSVAENITLPYLSRVSRAGFLNKRQMAGLVDDYIQRLSVRTPNRDQKLMNLSGGNQQKVILARWLSMEPRILLMDQPTRGIDIGAKEEIYQLMYNLAQSGVAIVFVGTEIPELLRICNRIYVMRSGKMVAELEGAQCTEQDLHLATVGVM